MAIYPKGPDDEFKQYIYEQFSRMGKVFASSQRLILLNILCQGEHHVEALARYSGLSIANVSRHLQVLKGANLVQVRKEGRQIFYSLADEKTGTFMIDFFNFTAAFLPEINQALEKISESPSRSGALTTKELFSRLKNVIVVDVRPAVEFMHCHIEGALSLPLEDLEEKRYSIPKEKDIVVYCRNRFCVLGDRAVLLLKEHGYRVSRLESGLQDWKQNGYPVTEKINSLSPEAESELPE